MQVTGNKSLHPYSLSIRISADGFSFLIRRSAQGEIIQRDNFLVDTPDEMGAAMRRALMRPKLMERNFQHVTVEVDGPCTRIPLDEFRREELSTLYQLTFSSLDMAHRRIHYEILSMLEVAELFSLPLEVEDAILQVYPDARITGLYGHVMQQWCALDRKSPAGLYAYLGGEQMLLFSFSSGQLRFANTYATSSAADRLYFLLYVWKTLELSQESDRCVLLGEDDELQAMLAKYVRNIDSAPCE